MKSFKKIAVTVLATVMMLLMSVTVFAADSPVKTSFNASLAKKTVTYNAKKQTPKVVVKDANGKTINKKYYKVTYSKQGFKNAGKYKVTITGKGKYAGYKETIPSPQPRRLLRRKLNQSVLSKLQQEKVLRLLILQTTPRSKSARMARSQLLREPRKVPIRSKLLSELRTTRQLTNSSRLLLNNFDV